MNGGDLISGEDAYFEILDCIRDGRRRLEELSHNLCGEYIVRPWRPSHQRKWPPLNYKLSS